MTAPRKKVKERSAGAVVYSATPEGPEYLLLRYGGGNWGFPQGHVEAGETDVQAAQREVGGETGIPIHPQKRPGGIEAEPTYRVRRGPTPVGESTRLHHQ